MCLTEHSTGTAYPDSANDHTVRLESSSNSSNLSCETLARVSGPSAGEPAFTPYLASRQVGIVIDCLPVRVNVRDTCSSGVIIRGDEVRVDLSALLYRTGL